MKNIYVLLLVLCALSIATAQPNGNESNLAEISVKTIVSNRKANPERIPKIEISPTIDGIVDDEIWKSAAKFELSFQTYPGENTAVTNPTEAFVMYDTEYLYVAFKCWDERGKIRARVATAYLELTLITHRLQINSDRVNC